MSSPVRLVVVGGSAGALGALQGFFEAVPPASGFAYLVIQHMSPDHVSHLDGLIAKHTVMPAIKLFREAEPQPDHVYVNLPGKFPVFEQGMLRYAPDSGPIVKHRPIDTFCRSLPAEIAASAVLVILSGTGNDGAGGAARIKEAGGTVIVQEPRECVFPGMPESVLERDLADLAMSVAEIGALMGILPDSARFADLVNRLQDKQAATRDYAAILQLVSAHCKRDMGVYKVSTLRRRINRRMGLHHLDDPARYLALVRDDAVELDQLAKDLLIGVTGFFRDLEAFQIVRDKVVPALCRARSEGDAVRVWVAGCSTGEEAYSVAMLFLDWFQDNDRPPALQIFATDVDDVALGVARAGVYPRESLDGIDASQVRRYFVEDRDGLRITKAVRERIVFASHNLIGDPPFSKLDLVVCRNLLIYLNPIHQKKLLSLFHFVLNPDGYLFLGSSENIGNVARHFKPLSKQWRLFVHTDGAPRRPPLLPLGGGGRGHRDALGSEANTSALASQGYFRQLLDSYGPTLVLVDAQNQVLYVSGETAPYMTVPVGQPSQDLFKIIRPELIMSLRSAMNQVGKGGRRVAVSVTLPGRDGDAAAAAVRLEVTPVGLGEGQPMLLLGFSPDVAAHTSQPVDLTGGENWLMQQLVQELNATREDLQRTIEQSRTANEEMRAANEEVMAMNEELQSANEELESSKEELQSLNEELSTSNGNLDAKVAEVEALNTDLMNLLVSSESSTLLLDGELGIRHFTPACTRLMRIIAGDLGRNIGDVVRLFQDPSLINDCRKVLKGLAVHDREIKSDDGRWYLRRILPYRDSVGAICGVVLDFTEFTDIKLADDLLQERAAALQWQANLLSRAAPVVGRDLADRIVFWNRGAESLYGWTEQEAMGRQIHQFLQTRFPRPLEQIRATLFDKGVWKGEVTHLTKSGGEVIVDSQWTLHRDDDGEATAVVEVNNDISERKRVQLALREQETMFRTMVDWAFNWEYWLDPAGEIVYMTPSVERLTGYTAEEFGATPALLEFMVHEADRHLWAGFLRFDPQAVPDQVKDLRLRLVRKNGELRWFEYICRPVLEPGGRFLGLRLSARDITEQVDAEKQIRNLAYFDPLTGLPNRRLLMDRLGQGLIASGRSGRYGALLLIDLDRFKEINDSRGHEMGDRLLLDTARRLSRSVRKEDTVARLGGDEFVVQLENLAADEGRAAGKAEQIAEAIRGALDHCFDCEGGQTEYMNSCSIGVTLFHGAGNSAEILLKQADLAMYQAKDAGRNAIRFFNPAMQAAIEERLHLIAGMRQALEQQDFRLHYQPQCDSAGRLVGAEALLRWDRREQGLQLPSEFVPLAEENGFILQLGAWAMNAAMAQLKAWESQPDLSELTMSINVSPKQFLQKDFSSQVKAGLERSGCRADRLVLEITESMVLESLDKVLEQMSRLRSMGIGFALDDFGTGCSSLYYLKRLPFCQLKIDQSFVSDIEQDSNDAVIIQAILAMGRALGLDTVAEGVETREQRDFLLANGCPLFQGHYFGRPLPAEDWLGAAD